MASVPRELMAHGHTGVFTCRGTCQRALTAYSTPACQVSSRFAELREAVGSIFIDEADLKHVRGPPVEQSNSFQYTC